MDRYSEKNKGDKDMSMTAEKLKELREEMKKINKDIPVLKSGENDVIELDPQNPMHKEWYEGRQSSLVSFGELYLAKVYYKGAKGSYKDRPVLIVDDSEEDLVTFAELTTKPPKYFGTFKVEVYNWKTAGLDKQSWVKCYIGNIHRVHKSRMFNKIGLVNPNVITEVLEKIINPR